MDDFFINKKYTGYLKGWLNRTSSKWNDKPKDRVELEKWICNKFESSKIKLCSTHALKYNIDKIKRHIWMYQFEVCSETPLNNEDIENYKQKQYYYILYYIITEETSLILTVNDNVYKWFLSLIEIQQQLNPFSPIHVNIDNMTKDLTSLKNKPYYVSYISGKISGMGEDITSLTLYGNNIVSSSLYKGYKDNIEVLTCGLKDKFLKTEVMRINTEGYFSFFMKSNDDIKAILISLNFIKEYFINNGFTEINMD